MSELIIFLVVAVLLFAPLAFVIWVVLRLNSLRDAHDSLQTRVLVLELRGEPPGRVERSAAPAPQHAPAPQPPASPREPAPRPAPVAVAKPAMPQPPPLPPTRTDVPPVLPPPLPVSVGTVRTIPRPAASAQPEPAPLPVEPRQPWINWEDFLGVKLFAWIGALLLFLVAGFFIKYSFERNLVTPAMRIGIGYALGAGLLVTAFRLNRERFAVTIQSLAAAAVLIFYGSTWGAHALYGFLTLNAAFVLMGGITFGAFALAVRMPAQPVAVIGLLGGFLTPLLLSSGEDRPAALFSYVALLDVGLVAVALKRRWNHLVTLGWAGTALLQFAWWAKYFGPHNLAPAITSGLLFCALFTTAHVLFHRRKCGDLYSLLPALLAPALAHLFTMTELLKAGGAFAGRPALFFCNALAVSAAWLFLARLDRRNRPAHFAAAAAMTTLVLMWSVSAATPGVVAVAMNLHLALAAVFVALHAWTLRAFADDRMPGCSAVLACGAALFFALLCAANLAPAQFPSLPRFFSFLFIADALLLVVAAQRPRWRALHLPAGGAVFLVMALWMGRHLDTSTLYWALGAALLSGLLHAAYPVVLEKLLPARRPVWWAQIFPLLSMALLALSVLKLSTATTLLWPVVLVLAFAGILIAAATGSTAGVIALTLGALGVCALWMFRLPMETARLTEIVLVLGGLSVVLSAAAVWFQRRAATQVGGAAWEPDPFSRDLESSLGVTVAQQLPAMPTAMPFLLLTLLAAQMPMMNPAPVFLLAGGLGVLLLALARWSKFDALCAVGLVATALLELVWRANNAALASPGMALAWHLGFAALYFAYPLVFRHALRDRALPWIVAALAFPLHFQFIYKSARAVWETLPPGLIPAALIVPPLAVLAFLVRWLPADAPRRTTQLAVYASAVSFFVTLIFPVQFDNQWLTLGWALQGAAKLWLYRRIPHRGLKLAGVALLLVAFARLALNPAVLDYAPRGGMPVLNWYLYTYGIVAACLFAGARLLRADDHGAGKLRALLVALGTVLLFLLMNIEIADAFSTGERITFEFSGNFGRDMAYSLGWTLFAAALLAVGISRGVRAARWAGLALLGVTLLKLAFHDLWQLGGLYRIGSFFGMAVVLMLVSFGYQRLRARTADGETPPDITGR